MGNRTDKPKQTARQLIVKMKIEKGISFKYTSESDAEYYLAKELKHLFFNRMPEKKGFFRSNELIKSNYSFACKVISAFF